MVFSDLTKTREAELYAIRKTEWSVEEYRALADRYADAVLAFKIAIENEQFAGVRAAYLSLTDITAKTAEMNIGLWHAIEQAQKSAQTEYMR